MEISSQGFSQKKFLSLSLEQAHLKAAKLLKVIWQENLIHNDSSDLIHVYKTWVSWKNWPPLDPNLTSPLLSSIADRFHFHMKRSSRGSHEEDLHPFPSSIKEPAPFLPITIYLDRLRYAHNIGSIARSCEALRLGELAFPPETTTLEHKQSERASMGTSQWLPWRVVDDIQECPRPWIALENSPNATALRHFSFPQNFTLIIGNESDGIHPDILSKADYCVKIPMFGRKNCLNVANAFSICAYEIRSQHPGFSNGEEPDIALWT